jgi:hypothetical protein
MVRQAVTVCLLALAAGALYGFRIAPLQNREAVTRERVKELTQLLEKGNREIKDVQALDQRLSRASVELRRGRGEAPAGAAMAWLPAQVKRYLAEFGITDSATRFNTSIEEPRFPGYERTFWEVAVPLRRATDDARTLLTAVTQLEKSNPILIVIAVNVDAGTAEPGSATAVINLAALVRK